MLEDVQPLKAVAESNEKRSWICTRVNMYDCVCNGRAEGGTAISEWRLVRA
jgi:hypothetical protein